MKKIFTLLTGLALASGFANAGVQVTVYSYTYNSETEDFDDYVKPFTTELVRTSDCAFTFKNFFNSGEPVSFSLQSIPEKGVKSYMSFTEGVTPSDEYPDYPDFDMDFTAYDLATDEETTIYYPYVSLKTSYILGLKDEYVEPYGGHFYGWIVTAGILTSGEDTPWIYLEFVFDMPEVESEEDPGDDPGESADDVTYIFNTDFENGQTNGFFSWTNEPTVVDGALEITNTEAKNSWEAQFAFDFSEPLVPGTEYTLKMKAKGSVATDANFDAAFQFPNSDAGYPTCGNFGQINLTTEYKEITLTTTCEVKDNWEANRLVFSFGKYIGTIYIDEISLSCPKSSAISEIEIENADAPVEFYNLSGVRVNNPSNGLFIRKQGSKVQKVIIR